jgi:hypothetical protein
MDSKGIFIIIGLVVVAIVVFISNYYSKKAIVKRKLKKAPGKKISDITSGETAKVTGNIQITGEPLIAPLSGRKCALYYILIEEKVHSGKSSHWDTLIEEEVTGSYVIRDGRNYAYINSKDIKSYIVQDRNFSSGFMEDATEVLEKYLSHHGKKSEGFLGFNKTIRYKEGVLEEGEMIAVIGKGTWRNPEQLNLNFSAGRILEITGSKEEPVYLSDDPETIKTNYRQDTY